LIELLRNPSIGSGHWAKAMGYNHRNDEIHDNIVRMQREWEAQRDALATVRPGSASARRTNTRYS
jgi:hypothetical protein